MISVIIPVYNTERYIDRCLESVTSQSVSDIEIICVDDASTDGTPALLEAWKERDPRVRVIRNAENMLESVSRNVGLEAARGDYVYFIDSDDWIDQGYLEAMLEHAGKSGLPVVIDANYLHEYENGAKSTFPGDFGFIKDGETSSTADASE